jgi:hypothetical protein
LPPDRIEVFEAGDEVFGGFPSLVIIVGVVAGLLFGTSFTLLFAFVLNGAGRVVSGCNGPGVTVLVFSIVGVAVAGLFAVFVLGGFSGSRMTYKSHLRGVPPLPHL